MAADPGSVDAALAMMDRGLEMLQLALNADPSAGECERALAGLERHGRRTAAVRMRVVSVAGRSTVAQDAGFASTESWLASRTQTPRGAAARQVALSTELESGHDVTAAALDEGLVSASHAAVIVRASRELPVSVTPDQRQVVERRLVEDAQRLDPDQLRRRARRVLETIEPDQSVVDAHENELVADEEDAAREQVRADHA